jgi:hypothetical protein
MDFFNNSILPLLGSATFAFTPAVKCPGVKDSEMAAKNMNICRKFLYESVDAYKPKLIIPLGNLAFKMLTKKSGILKNHGTELRYNEIPVVPTFNLNIIFIEPKHTEVIVQDISQALVKFIDQSLVPIDVKYQILNSLVDVVKFIDDHGLSNTTTPIAIDIESEGLNFLTHKVLTLALSFRKDGHCVTACIPFFHKESKIEDMEHLSILVNEITSNPNNIKIMHNAKFDMKFLKLLGITFSRVYDTKGMAHLVDEYQHGSLKSLVKKFLPNSLEYL